MATLDILSGEYPSTVQAVDAYIEERQRRGHTGWDQYSDFKSVKVILALRPATQVQVVRELLARFVISGQNGFVDGHLGPAYGFQLRPIMSFILRKRLPLELSDVVALLEVIRRLDGTYSSQYVPMKVIINHVGRFVEANGLPGELRDMLLAVRDQLRRGHRRFFDESKPAPAEAEALKSIEKVLGRPTTAQAPSMPQLAIEPGEPWAERAISDLQRAGSQRPAWIKLICHAFTAESAKPSGKWLSVAKSLLTEISPDTFQERLLVWASLVGQPFDGTLIWKTYQVSGERGLVRDSSALILRGLVWAASTIQEPEVMLALGALADVCFKKVPMHGPRCPKLGNACLWELSQSRLTEAVAELSRLSGKARHASTRTMTDRALNAAAKAAGQTREDLEEIAVPTHGLDADGSLRRTLDPFTLTISIDAATGAQLTIADSEGKLRRTVPADLRSQHGADLKAFQRTFTAIQTALAAQRQRVESILRLPDRSWPIVDWRTRYLDKRDNVKHLGRRAFNLAAAVSFLALVATCVLWIRSEYVEDTIFIRRDSNQLYQLFSSRGQIGWMVDPGDMPGVHEVSHVFGLHLARDVTTLAMDWRTDSAIPMDWRFLGFCSSWMLWLVPFWAVAALTAVLPIFRVTSFISTSRRHRGGLCPSCGYDLRASPNRCPECGAVPTEKAAK